MLLTSPFNIDCLPVSLCPMSLPAFCVLELLGSGAAPLLCQEKITREFPLRFPAPLAAPSGTVFCNGVIAWTVTPFNIIFFFFIFFVSISQILLQLLVNC